MVRGRLERLEGQVIVGWLLDERTPEARVKFDLVVNGRVAGTFTADRPRGDLKRKGVGDGCHAFRIDVAAEWLQPGQNTFKVEPHSDRHAIRDEVTFDFDSVQFEVAGPAERYPAGWPEITPDKIPVPIHPTAVGRSRVATPAVHTLRNRSPRHDRIAATITQSDAVELIAKIIAEGRLEEPTLFAILEPLFKEGRHRDVVLIGDAAGGTANSYRCRNFIGRAYLNVGRYEDAVRLLSAIKESEPKRHGAIFYLGLALSKVQLFKTAYDTFIHCITIKEDEPKYHLEAARSAVALAFGGYGVTSHVPEFIHASVEHYRRAAALAPGDFRPLREIAPIYLHLGRHEGAYNAALRATEVGANESVTWLELSRTLARLNRFDEALQACRTAAKLDPHSDSAHFAVRILERFQRRFSSADTYTVSIISNTEEREVARNNAEVTIVPCTADLGSLLTSLASEWISFDEELLADLESVCDQIKSHGFNWAGGLGVQLADGQTLLVWRRRFLARLVEAGSLARTATQRDLVTLASRVGALVHDAGANYAPDVTSKPTAILISQYGIHKFGGAEQFLEQMGRLYKELGYSVLVVGTRAEFIGDTGEYGGLRYTFVEGTADELFRTAVDENASLVHVVSGLGYEVAVAMQYLRVKLIFGVHFWRELFYNPTPSLGYFPDVDRKAEIRPEFDLILGSFDAIYSNSVYTRQVLEEVSSIRTSIIYSLPDGVSASTIDINPRQRAGVLLANARADKGFDLLLDVAEQLPEVRFTAIASQSGRCVAEAMISERGLNNIEVLSRVSDMEALYRQIRVALVPSFKFVETFSRVVIEAQRFGVPVIGSDRGNVPYLLTESGLSLPENALLWANEIKKLHESEEYWRERSLKSLENSERFSFSSQKGRLSRLVSGLEKPILIGVGSGLGNVIHTTPLIRNMARRLGRRVDVVVAGDYKDLLFCVANDEYVSHAFLLNETVLERRYETVYLTHSFGSVVPRFSSNKVIESRAWDMFSADHPLHEAEFNLAAAEALLEINYEEEDVRRYYVGNYSHTKPQRVLVGIHGGSKGGIWGSKRWPHFADLAEALKSDGIAVASFGTPDEYIAGTLDKTGGSIEQMAREMLACSHFVSNDSGVMNIANALGIPLVALFGPTNPQTRGPLGQLSRSLFIEKECAPCEVHHVNRKARFLNGTCRCISEIPLSAVMHALKDLDLWDQIDSVEVAG